MSTGQLALTGVLVALLAGVQLWSYQTFDALAETTRSFGLARNVSGTLADAQRDALRSQVLVEQLASGRATVTATRQPGWSQVIRASFT